ncbi:non-ribosomal peptide synthetase-like protein [Antricoccus suffuscus]|uniref:Non-ribosomal peptide synthetase-like protein n=1 Tax=Antricoccus suffuscus TaxID=1629062 RepID=A0A2T1A3J1_9ACTN|nr:Pls/PosA family non-ribosomal peptide synthetase [Antricoccus suffuscus]PRZ43181.1 non-ribosomal peptide synthetase-like protein [Antricoccus suffuscus]
MTMLRGDRRPDERTLVDVLRATAAAYPGKPALDDGTSILSYAELTATAERIAAGLAADGVRQGDRVGIQIPSGTSELYLAILGILIAGAAYVPVDADDPPERAELVFGQAAVTTILDSVEQVRRLAAATDAPPSPPTPDNDCWIIFTSGSTGLPKGVAVSHRSGAAFVDAEARLFLQDEPIGPGDRVLAGLSVAFDASCEEMWLAWRYGACLVPAPRALVRTGMDLGPWLVARHISIVSTVPTLAALWPADSLDDVRLLIFGGEACPPELAERLVTDSREVWNTYGPTEATVVACAAQLTGDGPVRIGLPLDGWDLAVVNKDTSEPVGEGEIGELVIGGVGLAHYLDPIKDAEKYVAMPTLGWDRAYRSGDLVQNDAAGLLFVGRADEQIKLGGRRIELGEVDAALQSLPGIAGGAAAVKTTAGGNQVLVGYVVPADDVPFDQSAARARLTEALPAALVPMLAAVDTLPTRTSGKVDRDALPWPIASAPAHDEPDDLTETETWVADRFGEVLGVTPTSRTDDFFANGGGSLTAAQLVSKLRQRYPEVTVADLYAQPSVGSMTEFLESKFRTIQPASQRGTVQPTRRRTQLLQLGLSVIINTIAGARWVVILLLLTNIVGGVGDYGPAPVSWWLVGGGALILLTPFGRMTVAVLGTRLLLYGVRPGAYDRGGKTHIKLWAAERLTDAVGAANLAGAPWIPYYARALGCKIGKGVDLHSLPPITGMLELGGGCSVEPEVDLSGYWIDGDLVHIGAIKIGARATIGSRSTMGPGSSVGRDSDVAPGSAVFGDVPTGEFWSGSPARRMGRVKHPWPEERPPRATAWVWAYGASSLVMALLPVLAAIVGLWIVKLFVGDANTWAQGYGRAMIGVPLGSIAAFVTLAVLILGFVRLLGLGLREGAHPVRSRIGWQVWATERLLDTARTLLFPIYASLFTPVWLRALGAKIGKNVEASTVLLVPKMTEVRDGAFLADDTMVASYELGGGWMRIARAKVGKRAFLGNSGMAHSGRRVPKDGLVAVLSAAPHKSKSGTSWLGSPPVKLRRNAQDVDSSLTHKPSKRLKVMRSLVEVCRAIPVIVSGAIGVSLLLTLQLLHLELGLWQAFVLSGVVLAVVGAVAAGITTAAKWLIVGRIPKSEHPLWSSFVWRNEVVDTFVEFVAAPWFAAPATGTPVLNLWLRTIGAHIGRGVWCESYWLPEADLVRLEDGATVNRGCVVQTHLFHDRVMSLDSVVLGRGATLGPHSVILPAAQIDDDATVGPASLVMRGESVPARSLWQGNPISPWSTNAPKMPHLSVDVAVGDQATAEAQKENA